MIKNSRYGTFAIFDGIEYPLCSNRFDNTTKWAIWGLPCIQGHTKFDAINSVNYMPILPNQVNSAYHVSHRAEYEGLSLVIGGSKENGFYLFGNGDPEFDKKHGMNYKGTDRFFVLDEKIDSIWEERTPIKGFPFNTEKIVYLKMYGKWLE